VTPWLLFVACVAAGQHPAECWGVATTESGMRTAVTHALPTVHGLCGVDERWSPLPAWALSTTVGGAIGCAIAIRDVRRLHGRMWTARYVCGARGVASHMPSCVRAQRRLEASILRARGILARSVPKKEV
jgi:hypothetical protein